MCYLHFFRNKYVLSGLIHGTEAYDQNLFHPIDWANPYDQFFGLDEPYDQNPIQSTFLVGLGSHVRRLRGSVFRRSRFCRHSEESSGGR